MVRISAGLATLAALLAAATPAAASSAHGTSVFDELGDPCTTVDKVTFTAGAGEINHVTVAEGNTIVANPFFGPPCDDLYLAAAALADPAASIRPSGTCRFTLAQTNRAVSCPMKDGLTVSLGDGDDSFTLLGDGLAAGVSCGPGNDVVVGDVATAGDCETVLPG
ncbi:MAG: hypothetical protein WD844_17425 [Thermoleophilaceae bacterium]